MGKGPGLDTLIEIFGDKKIHIACAIVTKLSLAEDRSVLRCRVKTLPDEDEMIVRCSWPAVGNGAGIIVFPQVDDLVLIAHVEGDEDAGFIITRLSSNDEPLPEKAIGGHTVIRSVPGLEVRIDSDTKIDLFCDKDIIIKSLTTKIDAFAEQLIKLQSNVDILFEATENITENSKKHHIKSDRINLANGAGNALEPLILGLVFKDFATQLLTLLSSDGNKVETIVGPGIWDPAFKTAIGLLKTTFIDTAVTDIFSKFTFTEKGPLL